VYTRYVSAKPYMRTGSTTQLHKLYDGVGIGQLHVYILLTHVH
jgi:hypothetical protein